MLISKLAQTFEKFGCKRQYAAFSLDRFKENSGTVVFIDQPSDIIKIVSLCVDETVREGAKIGMETVLTGSGKRGYCCLLYTSAFWEKRSRFKERSDPFYICLLYTSMAIHYRQR